MRESEGFRGSQKIPNKNYWAQETMKNVYLISQANKTLLYSLIEF